MTNSIHGYAGRILRVDLSGRNFSDLQPDEATWRKYVGGTALGARLLYDTVPPGVAWDDPGNRVVLMTGPLAGTSVAGGGTFSVVFKGPMTNLAGATQANGFLGAYLKFSGFDGLILEGASPDWVYLYVHDGVAELRSAEYLLGKNTLETEEAVAKELGLSPRKVSVFAIGPAGERRVRFAALVGDRGHVAAHNGIGAVLGAKRVKAIAVARGKQPVEVKDRARLRESARSLLEYSRHFSGGLIANWGTAGLFESLYATGMVPVRNYATNLFPQLEPFTGQSMRTHFPVKSNPCWACGVNHLRTIKITEGPYAGFEGEEPEYECAAAWGPLIGQTDPAAAIVLSNLTDWLGLDVNETGGGGLGHGVL